MPEKRNKTALKRMLSAILAVCILAGLCCVAFAEEVTDVKTVRIGYYEDNEGFQAGFSDEERKSGYAYEYYQEIAKHTGWEYEYVYGSWGDIYQKLLNGEVDIVAGVSKTENRLERMLFPTSPMGSELYYVFVPANSEGITSDPASLNGKRIGVNENSFMLTLFERYVEENALDCQIKTYNGHYSCEDALEAEEIDGYVITDNYTVEGVKPIIKIGGSDIYFAVSRGRMDILNGLNSAQDEIFASEPYYNSILQQKYFDKSVLRQALNDKELKWLKEKGTLVFGCLDDYLPYCGIEQKTGESTGAFTVLKNEIANFTKIPVEIKFYHTYDEMVSALISREVDAVFPIYGDTWLSEQKNIVQTSEITNEPAMIAYKGDYGNRIFAKIACAKTGVLNAEFIRQNFPEAEIYEYEDLKACLEAVISGEVGSAVCSRNVMHKRISSDARYGTLHTSYLYDSVSLSMATATGNPELVSIVNKALSNIEPSIISDAVIQNTYNEGSYSLRDFIQRNPMQAALLAAAMLALIVLCFVLYYFKTKKSERELLAEKEKAKAVNENLMKQISISKAWRDASEMDALTGLMNRGGGEARITELLERGVPGLFCLFDIDAFKRINDVYGHTTGDSALKIIADCMRKAFRSNDVLVRFGGDEFAIFAPEIVSETEAENCIKRLMDLIDSAEVKGMGGQCLSASLGAVLCRGKRTFQSVYRKSDRKLYSCKDDPLKKYELCALDEGEETQEPVIEEKNEDEAPDYRGIARGIIRQELQSALDNTNICTFLYFPKKRCVSASEKAQRTYHTEAVFNDMPESYAEKYVLEEDRRSYIDMFQEILDGAESATTVFRSKSELFQCKVTLNTLSRDKEGAPLTVLGIIEDQSEEYGVVKTLSQNFTAILSANLVKNKIEQRKNADLRFQELVDFFEEERSYDEFIEFYGNTFIEADLRQEFLEKMSRKAVTEELNRGNPVIVGYKRVSDGESHYMEVRIASAGAEYRMERCVMAFRCVDDSVERELAVKIDDITGVFRKNSFYEEAEKAVLKNPEKNFVAVSFDIDSFRIINDTMGMRVGDRVLRRVGDIIGKNEKLKGIVAVAGHLYADNFAALCEFGEGGEKLFMRTVFEELKSALPDFSFSLRFGFCKIDDPNPDMDVYCSRANTALRSIKGNYEHHYAWFSEAMLKTLVHEQKLDSTMEEALEHGEFVPYFQPQYNYVTGEIIGAEALVRWIHPKKGVVMPDDFIPYFEKCGFVYQLDTNIWEQTCRQLREWLDKGFNIPHLSVNVSIIDISHEDFLERLKELTEKYDLLPQQLHLEFTESAFRDNSELQIQVVKKIKSLGFLVEMDDFGSGYSSLNSLKNVPTDVLKLDMKFLEKGDKTGKGGNILSSIVHMSHSINIPIIAEGVETKEQADFLKSIGCCYMQGYYFSKPVGSEKFEELLSAQKGDRAEEIRNTGIDNAADFLDASTQSNLLFNSFVGGAGIFEYSDGKLKALRINDKFLEVCRTTWEEFTGFSENMFAVVTEETKPAVIKMLEDAIKTGDETSCYHCSGIQKEGEGESWYFDRARCLTKNADNAVFYISLENISERVKLEKNNEQLTKELSTIVKNIPDAIARGYIDENGTTHLQYFSPVFEKLLGYDLEEFSRINMNDPFEIVHPEDIEKVNSALEKTFYRGEDYHLQYRLRRKDGSYVWLEVFGKCYIENGQKEIYLIYSDISEEREKEEELRVRESEFRVAVIQSGRMICRYTVADRAFHIYKDTGDEFGSVTYVENAPEAFIENGYIMPESREAWRKMFAAIDRGEPKGKINELGIARIKGGWRWYSVYFTTVETKDGKPLAAVISFEDITDRRIENKNRAFEYNGLYKVLSKIYTMVIACNLTRNSYYMIEYEKFANHTAANSGVFDKLIEDGLSTVPEEERQAFSDAFSRENLIKAFNAGKDTVRLEHGQYDDNGELHRMETIVMRIDDPYDHDLLEMTISRVME